MFRKIQHIHLIGIGGSGMCGIAEVLLNLGYKVTGSDLQYTDTIKRIEGMGGRIFVGHNQSNIEGAQVVVVSSAVHPENPEVVAAREKFIPVIKRAEMLAELMRLKFGIAIAGAHGKTTTTSIIATLLAHAGLDPTVVIGGKLNSMGSNAKLGKSEFLVAEADESDGSFLLLSPAITVVTTIDREHLDHYGDMENLKKAFLDFINKIPFYGLSVLCLDEGEIQALIPSIQKRYITYGITVQADLMARDIKLKEWGSNFSVSFKGEDLGRFHITVPGIHNIYNALAAIGVGLELDLKPEDIRNGLSEFSGVERRFHLRGDKNGIMIIDDYGHHPTEIKATLKAAKTGWDRRLIAIFQPHRYTRTRDLLKEFATSFYDADILIITEIYPAGELPIEGISGLKLFELIRGYGHKKIIYIPQKGEIAEKVVPILRKGDMVITLGAGDIWKVGPEILAKLPDEKRHD
ncbi:MAG: UDP-N-acetylmuramate--L-alanine ligase [Nitrospirae bacterium]|nr:UDP-N-acetylmuramate--L-alanine ligase [Nitrospirota bacterium]